MAPSVSVVMTVFNGASYVAEAVDSVLQQTVQDLELIVVNDASTDPSAELLARYTGDKRVRVLHNDTNRGTFFSANRGLERARAPYVARLDCDDVCRPDRLEKQLALLDSDRSLGIVGSSCTRMDERGRTLRVEVPPLSDLHIRWASLLRNPFLHSTVVLRRELLAAHGLRYDGSLRVGGDYELWPRILRHARGQNLAEPLVRYRVRTSGITGTQRPLQLGMHDKVSLRTIREELSSFPARGLDLIALRRWMAQAPPVPSGPSLPDLVSLHERLLEGFLAKHGLANASTASVLRHGLAEQAQRRMFGLARSA
jgi:glycosyltransferase involved in cell wall biosynthesis